VVDLDASFGEELFHVSVGKTEPQVPPDLWGSETPIILVTCGFSRAGRCQIVGVAFLEGLNEVLAANRCR